MNVSDVLQDKEKLINSIVTIRGYIIELYDEIFILENEHAAVSKSDSIRVVQVKYYEEKHLKIIPARIGGPLFEDDAEVVGLLSKSQHPDFPVEIVDLQSAVITRGNEKYRLEF